MTIDKLENQQCPFCGEKTLTLMEQEKDIPYFGKCFLFSMSCSSCKYHKADLETNDQNDPTKYTFEISSEDDMNVRVVKSSSATIKIPHIMTVEPGPASNGYITNIEGILNKIKTQLEDSRDSEEDNDKKKKLKNMIKKIQKVIWGQETLKLIIEDPTGNSAIIDEKAVKTKLAIKK